MADQLGDDPQKVWRHDRNRVQDVVDAHSVMQDILVAETTVTTTVATKAAP